MEDRETPRMRKYGESKTTRIMMATVPHVTSGLGLRKFQADGFLLTRVYISNRPTNPAALTAHHTPPATSNNGTLSLGNVSLRDHVPAEFKPSRNAKQNECGVSE